MNNNIHEVYEIYKKMAASVAMRKSVQAGLTHDEVVFIKGMFELSLDEIYPILTRMFGIRWYKTTNAGHKKLNKIKEVK